MPVNIEKDKGLRREINVWGLSANLVNIIVGAGIFVIPALVSASLGPAAILAYLLCGLLMLLVMFCFAEVGTRVFNSGGAYTYIEAAFGNYAGFLTAIFFMCSSITSDAAVANALAGVLSSTFPIFDSKIIQAVFFVVVIGVLAFINVLGVRQGIGLVKFTTIAKLAPLLLIIIFGWTELSIENLRWEGFPPMEDLGAMSLILFWAFQGGETGLAVSGEVINPTKTIPRAIFISIFGVLVLYLMIQITSQGILGSELGAMKDSPLAAVGEVIFGPIGFTIVTLGAAISMFGNLSGEVLNVPRVLDGAARDKVIPSPALARIHPKFATPYLSIITYAIIVVVLSILGGFKILATLSGAFMLLVYLGVACAVFRLRKVTPTTKDTFVIPGGKIIPILAILTGVWMLTGLEKIALTGGAGLILLISIVYVIIKRK